MDCHGQTPKVEEYKSRNKLCQAENCLHLARTKNFCPMHYRRLLRHGDPTITKKPRISSYREVPAQYRCSVDGCTRLATTLGWCSAHYQRYHRHGSTDIKKSPGRPRTRDGRPIDLCEVPTCPNIATVQGLCAAHNRAQAFCREDGCDRPHMKGKVYCDIHYTPETCLEPYCEREQWTGGRCRSHHTKYLRNLDTYGGIV